jgi:hypothetical protein
LAEALPPGTHPRDRAACAARGGALARTKRQPAACKRGVSVDTNPQLGSGNVRAADRHMAHGEGSGIQRTARVYRSRGPKLAAATADIRHRLRQRRGRRRRGRQLQLPLCQSTTRSASRSRRPGRQERGGREAIGRRLEGQLARAGRLKSTRRPCWPSSTSR